MQGLFYNWFIRTEYIWNLNIGWFQESRIGFCWMVPRLRQTSLKFYSRPVTELWARPDQLQPWTSLWSEIVRCDIYGFKFFRKCSDRLWPAQVAYQVNFHRRHVTCGFRIHHFEVLKEIRRLTCVMKAFWFTFILSLSSVIEP